MLPEPPKNAAGRSWSARGRAKGTRPESELLSNSLGNKEVGMLSPPSWRRSLLPGVLCLSTRPDRTPCASFPRHRRRLSSCQEQAAQRKRSGMKGHERWPWAALGGLGPASGRAQLRGRRCERALQPPKRLDLPASSPHSHEAVLLHGAPVPRTWRVHVEGTRGGHTWKAHVEGTRGGHTWKAHVEGAPGRRT